MKTSVAACQARFNRRRLPSLICFVLAGLTALTAEAQSDEASPFTTTPSTAVSNGCTYLCLTIHVPRHHHIYADRLSFEINGGPAAVALPAPRTVADKFSKKQRPAYESDFQVACPLPEGRAGNLTFAVDFQGCSESECYFPESHQWIVHPDNSLSSPNAEGPAVAPVAATESLTNGFHVASRATGYLGADKFLRFLDASPSAASGSTDLSSSLARFGLVATLGLILLGGLALNLTPCVLPMIPINLAILGAGTRNRNRRRGLLLGSTYGGGMALAYGVLGLVVVLTGSRFGALNASPWFNFAIALVFVVLGLAMFDRLAIDLSRFQPVGGRGSVRGGAFLAAGFMGSVSALLAGACVAPVVISVLLLATTFYQQGNWLGLVLPFALGLGMALPWPFAGAGLSFLPKPGAWMSRVKYTFGVIILGFAAWYGWLGWNLAGFGGAGPMLVSARGDSLQEFRSALEQSRATGRPVCVDFWASWCKNCEAMEHSTFRDSRVHERLSKDYLLVRIEAERLNDAALKPVLDQLGVLGLPTYVVLRPDAVSASSSQVSTAANH